MLAKVANKDTRTVVSALMLKGKALEKYVASIANRIEIVCCLAAEEKGGEELFAVEVYSCPRVPEVYWWGDLNHDSMIQLVNDRYNGVWWPYKDRWEGKLDRLMRNFNAGDPATVNELGFALDGAELGPYISQLVQMVSIVHCLANDAETRAKDTK